MCLQLVTGPPSRRQFYLQRLDRRQQRRLDRRKRKRCRTRHQTHPESGRVARAASINFNPPGNTSRREQRRRKTSRTRPRRLTTECSRRCTPNRRTGKNEACKPDRQQPPPRKGGGSACDGAERARAHSSRDLNCVLFPDDMMEGALVAGDSLGNKRWALRRKYEQSHVCLVGSQLVRPLTPKHRQSFSLRSFLAIELLQSRPVENNDENTDSSQPIRAASLVARSNCAERA